MAKKKNKSAQTKTTPKKTVKTVKNQKPVAKNSMVSKVEIQEKRSNTLSRIIGTVLIVLGIALIGYGVFSYIKSDKAPKLDEALTPPTTAQTSAITNAENIVVKGEAEGLDKVIVYIDNEEVGKARVNKDGEYEYEHEVAEEGKYIVATAGVKGFFKKFVTPKSDPIVVTVDRTAPELTDIKYSSEVGTDNFGVIGNAEPESTVVVKRGTDVYETKADETGLFAIKNIALEEGPNVYSVEVKDSAGNVNAVEEKIEVTYSKESSVNGNAVVDENLPVASGELEAALSVIRDGKIMLVLGLIAFVAFLASSGVVVAKRHRIEG